MAGSRSTASELASAAEPRRSGRAHHGGRTLALAVGAASRLSLQVELEGGARLADGTILDGVEIDLPRGPVRLGRCRFSAEGGAARETCGRLVFLDDVYDCRSLVEDGQYVDLRAFFQNLPLVLAQRERIRPEFRDWCANLVYDLSVFKRFFDEQDRIVAGEPDDVVHAARDALMRTEGRRFLDFLDTKVAEMNALIRDFTQEEHERHGFYLRRQVWPYLMASAFLQRTNLKPRGYAGDAELMIMLYENTYIGTYVFNQLMHKHPVETRAADAVRFRRALIPQVLRQVVPDFPRLPARGFRVLSLAAGPAWELYDIVRERADAEQFELTLLDQDPFALDLARETVRKVEAQHGVRLGVRYVEDSVRTMLRSRDLKRALGQHHFVYSMGLFDYLTTPVARAVLAKAYDLLEPGGTMLVGNYHVDTPTRWHMAYWADWSLCYRSEEGFLDLARELAPQPAAISIIYDESRCQMFMKVKKPR
jgi:extracellular factor (EF) 3-hydroxypalmitic acid methyl ester biosynthesis protein